jgi:hypothetical protein
MHFDGIDIDGMLIWPSLLDCALKLLLRLCCDLVESGLLKGQAS